MRYACVVWAALVLLLCKGDCCFGSCVKSPTSSDCEDYHYPNATDDVEANCNMMSMMPGCTINSLCSKVRVGAPALSLSVSAAAAAVAAAAADSPFCNPLSVLGDLCADMEMSPCKNFDSMCKTPGSKVVECTQYPPIPSLPTTDEVNKDVRAICASMNMDGCEKCDLSGADNALPDCDLLSVYSQLCAAMPDMDQCGPWKAMCKDLTMFPELCPSEESADLPPVMRQYFHFGIVDMILFHSWVPRTGAQYFLAVVAVLAACIAYEALQTAVFLLKQQVLTVCADTVDEFVSFTGGSLPQTMSYHNYCGDDNDISTTPVKAEGAVEAPAKALWIVGMACQPCVASVKRALGSVRGVDSVHVHFNAQTKEGYAVIYGAAAQEADLIEAVEAHGYGAHAASEALPAAVAMTHTINSGNGNGDDTIVRWTPRDFHWTYDPLMSACHAVQVGLGYLIMLVAMTFNVGLCVAVLAGLTAGHLLFVKYRKYSPKAGCH